MATKQTNQMSKQIDHPILGTIVGDGWLWILQRKFAAPFSSITPKEMSIAVDDAQEHPSSIQLQVMVDPIQAPDSFREEIENALFEAYRDEIRPDTLLMFGDDPLAYGVSPEKVPEILPEINEPTEIWRIVTGVASILVHEDAHIGIGFEVIFDEEHNVVVNIRDGHVDYIIVE